MKAVLAIGNSNIDTIIYVDRFVGQDQKGTILNYM